MVLVLILRLAVAMVIDTSNWKEFTLTKLFDIKGSKTTPKNNLNLTSDGKYPYITTAATNNGIAGYSDKYTEEGNVITIDSAVLGTAFYQKDNFTASDHVEKLIPKFEINELIGQYLASVLNASARYYQYAYNNKRSQIALKKEVINLPATPDGEPDWQYMESYMKKIMQESEQSIENLNRVEDKKDSIDISGWGKFKIETLFDSLLSKDDIQPKNIIEGDVPLISSGNTNNGIIANIKHDTATLQKANTITVDMFGKAFYQKIPYYCVSHGRVNILIPKFSINEYIGLFIVSVIEKTSRVKYSFSNMCTGTKLLKDIIYLPATPDGEPDWQYMENYMKKIIEESEQIISELQVVTSDNHVIEEKSETIKKDCLDKDKAILEEFLQFCNRK